MQLQLATLMNSDLYRISVGENEDVSLVQGNTGYGVKLGNRLVGFSGEDVAALELKFQEGGLNIKLQASSGEALGEVRIPDVKTLRRQSTEMSQSGIRFTANESRELANLMRMSMSSGLSRNDTLLLLDEISHLVPVRETTESVDAGDLFPSLARKSREILKAMPAEIQRYVVEKNLNHLSPNERETLRIASQTDAGRDAALTRFLEGRARLDGKVEAEIRAVVDRSGLAPAQGPAKIDPRAFEELARQTAAGTQNKGTIAFTPAVTAFMIDHFQLEIPSFANHDSFNDLEVQHDVARRLRPANPAPSTNPLSDLFQAGLDTTRFRELAAFLQGRPGTPMTLEVKESARYYLANPPATPPQTPLASITPENLQKLTNYLESNFPQQVQEAVKALQTHNFPRPEAVPPSKELVSAYVSLPPEQKLAVFVLDHLDPVRNTDLFNFFRGGNGLGRLTPNMMDQINAFLSEKQIPTVHHGLDRLDPARFQELAAHLPKERTVAEPAHYVPQNPVLREAVLALNPPAQTVQAQTTLRPADVYRNFAERDPLQRLTYYTLDRIDAQTDSKLFEYFQGKAPKGPFSREMIEELAALRNRPPSQSPQQGLTRFDPERVEQLERFYIGEQHKEAPQIKEPVNAVTRYLVGKGDEGVDAGRLNRAFNGFSQVDRAGLEALKKLPADIMDYFRGEAENIKLPHTVADSLEQFLAQSRFPRSGRVLPALDMAHVNQLVRYLEAHPQTSVPSDYYPANDKLKELLMRYGAPTTDGQRPFDPQRLTRVFNELAPARQMAFFVLDHLHPTQNKELFDYFSKPTETNRLPETIRRELNQVLGGFSDTNEGLPRVAADRLNELIKRLERLPLDRVPRHSEIRSNVVQRALEDWVIQKDGQKARLDVRVGTLHEQFYARLSKAERAAFHLLDRVQAETHPKLHAYLKGDQVAAKDQAPISPTRPATPPTTRIPTVETTAATVPRGLEALLRERFSSRSPSQNEALQERVTAQARAARDRLIGTPGDGPRGVSEAGERLADRVREQARIQRDGQIPIPGENQDDGGRPDQSIADRVREQARAHRDSQIPLPEDGADEAPSSNQRIADRVREQARSQRDSQIPLPDDGADEAPPNNQRIADRVREQARVQRDSQIPLPGDPDEAPPNNQRIADRVREQARVQRDSQIPLPEDVAEVEAVPLTVSQARKSQGRPDHKDAGSERTEQQVLRQTPVEALPRNIEPARQAPGHTTFETIDVEAVEIPQPQNRATREQADEAVRRQVNEARERAEAAGQRQVEAAREQGERTQNEAIEASRHEAEQLRRSAEARLTTEETPEARTRRIAEELLAAQRNSRTAQTQAYTTEFPQNADNEIRDLLQEMRQAQARELPKQIDAERLQQLLAFLKENPHLAAPLAEQYHAETRTQTASSRTAQLPEADQEFLRALIERLNNSNRLPLFIAEHLDPFADKDLFDFLTGGPSRLSNEGLLTQLQRFLARENFHAASFQGRPLDLERLLQLYQILGDTRSGPVPPGYVPSNERLIQALMNQTGGDALSESPHFQRQGTQLEAQWTKWMQSGMPDNPREQAAMLGERLPFLSDEARGELISSFLDRHLGNARRVAMMDRLWRSQSLAAEIMSGDTRVGDTARRLIGSLRDLAGVLINDGDRVPDLDFWNQPSPSQGKADKGGKRGAAQPMSMPERIAQEARGLERYLAMDRMLPAQNADITRRLGELGWAQKVHKMIQRIEGLQNQNVPKLLQVLQRQAVALEELSHFISEGDAHDWSVRAKSPLTTKKQAQFRELREDVAKGRDPGDPDRLFEAPFLKAEYGEQSEAAFQREMKRLEPLLKNVLARLNAEPEDLARQMMAVMRPPPEAVAQDVSGRIQNMMENLRDFNQSQSLNQQPFYCALPLKMFGVNSEMELAYFRLPGSSKRKKRFVVALHLNFEGWGHLRVDALKDHGKLAATFWAENPRMMFSLKAALPKFLDRLEELGMGGTHLSIQLEPARASKSVAELCTSGDDGSLDFSV